MTFNKKIKIQKLNGRTWEDFKTIWANVRGMTANEYFAAAAVQAEQTNTFTVRYSADVAGMNPQSYRIVFDGNQYDIKSIEDVNMRHVTIKIRAVRKYGGN